MLSHRLHHHHEETQVPPPTHTRLTSAESSLTEPWFWSRSKFFCSSGLLREVSEVNSMNESLQTELQVRSSLNPLKGAELVVYPRNMLLGEALELS